MKNKVCSTFTSFINDLYTLKKIFKPGTMDKFYVTSSINVMTKQTFCTLNYK